MPRVGAGTGGGGTRPEPRAGGSAAGGHPISGSLGVSAVYRRRLPYPRPRRSPRAALPLAASRLVGTVGLPLLGRPGRARFPSGADVGCAGAVSRSFLSSAGRLGGLSSRSPKRCPPSRARVFFSRWFFGFLVPKVPCIALVPRRFSGLGVGEPHDSW